MKRVALFGLAAALVGLIAADADAQLFRRGRNNVNINIGGGFQNAAAIQVRQQTSFRQPFLARQQSVTELTIAPNPQGFVTHQIVQQQRFRGQTDQLNTYTYAHNTAANIRFVPQNLTVLHAPPIVAAPIIEQHVQTVPAQVVQRVQRVQVREYVQPAPQTADPCPAPAVIPQATNNTPSPNDPAVQYLTQPQAQTAPQQVVERVVEVSRPVAVTQERVYVTSRPVRQRQFITHGCN